MSRKTRNNRDPRVGNRRNMSSLAVIGASTVMFSNTGRSDFCWCSVKTYRIRRSGRNAINRKGVPE